MDPVSPTSKMERMLGAKDGKRLGFAFKTGPAVRFAGNVLGQDLDGDVAVQPLVPRAVYFAIPPAPS